MTPPELAKYMLSDEFAGRLLRLRIEMDHRGENISSNLIADVLAIDQNMVPVLFSWLGAWIAAEETVERLAASRKVEFITGAIH